MTEAALLLAAGRGERFGHELPKAFVSIGEKPLVLYSLETLLAVQEIDCVIPVVAEGDQGRWKALVDRLGDLPKLAPAATGGAQRQDSVRAGLEALPADTAWVVIHDAARPWVRPSAVTRVIEAARRDGAALLAVPVRDTIKRARDGRVVETPNRAECFASQTPQVFRVELLREALARATAQGRVATDDAELVEWLGAPVTLVPGDPDNVKLTHPVDLAAAELRAASGGEGTHR